MKYKKTGRSKWFHHVGTLYEVKKSSNGELKIKGPHSPKHASISDAHLKDVFIWIGNYLAKKNKLPRHIKLDQVAVRSNRTTAEIRTVIANEMYQLTKD